MVQDGRSDVALHVEVGTWRDVECRCDAAVVEVVGAPLENHRRLLARLPFQLPWLPARTDDSDGAQDVDTDDARQGAPCAARPAFNRDRRQTAACAAPGPPAEV